MTAETGPALARNNEGSSSSNAATVAASPLRMASMISSGSLMGLMLSRQRCPECSFDGEVPGQVRVDRVKCGEMRLYGVKSIEKNGLRPHTCPFGQRTLRLHPRWENDRE